MLRMGWDDDLEAIVKSWRTANDWLSASDPVHPHRWQKPAYVNLQKLCGSRLARVPERLGRGDVFGVPLALYARGILLGSTESALPNLYKRAREATDSLMLHL